MTKPGHEPFDGLAALYAAGSLNDRERTAFLAHLEVCLDCVKEVTSLLPVTHGLLQVAPSVEAPAALRTRVLEQVTGGAPPRTRQLMDRRTETPTPPRRATHSPRRRHRTIFWLISMLAIAAAGAGGWHVVKLDRQITDLQTSLNLATLRTDILELEVTAAALEAAERGAVLALITTPDAQRLPLTGQPLAPRASALASWNSARELTLLASGLPPLPTGEIYQLWFVGQDAPVNAALMVPDAQGNAWIRLTVPDDVDLPSAMAVTIEPARGVTTPTGEVYLLGRPTL